MSSEFVVGIDDAHKASRVLAPPGGKDSIDLTGGSAPITHTGKKMNACQAQRNSSNVFETNDLGIQRKGSTESCQAKRQKSTVFAPPLNPQPGPTKPYHEKSSGNIIAANDGGQEKLHTSVHVRAPPGGASNFSFG